MADRKHSYRTASEAYSVRTQISLSPRQREAIASVCQRTGTTMAEFVRRAIDLRLAWQEDQLTALREAGTGSYGVLANMAADEIAVNTPLGETEIEGILSADRTETDISRVPVSIPTRLLDEIDRLARQEHRNRSEFIQEAARLYAWLIEQRRQPGQKPRIQQAVAIQDAIALQLRAGWDSTKEIRRWREARR